MAETGDRCRCCGGSPLSAEGGCARCGWNARRGQRRCLKCGGLVEGDYDVQKLKLPGGAMAVVAIVGGIFGGFLGSLALLLAGAAVGSVMMAFTFEYRCQDCDHVASQRLMFDGERDDIRDRRATSFMRAGLLGVASLVAAGLWASAVLATARVKPTAETPAPAAAQGPVAALAQANDLDGLGRALRDPPTSEAAANALVNIGDNAVPFVLPALEDEREFVRRRAVGALARIGARTDRAIDALIARVRQDPDAFVRRDAIDALAAMGGVAKRAIPAIEPLLADYGLGSTALSALERIDPRVDWAARRKALTGK